MTLPSRRKLQITAPITRFWANQTSTPIRRKRLQPTLLLSALCIIPSSTTPAQQPGWQPSRLPHSPHVQPLSQAGSRSSSLDVKSTQSSRASAESAEQLGDGVVLRWQQSSRVANTKARQSPTAVSQAVATHEQADPWLANPLRGHSGVRPANFQQTVPESSDPFKNPFGDAAPSLPQRTPPTLPPGNLPSMNQAADPLSTPENAPAPTQPLLEQRPSPFPDTAPQAKQLEQVEEPSPFDRRPSTGAEAAKDKDSAQGEEADLALPSRIKSGSTASCDEIRQRVRTPLSSITLNSSPRFGEGLASDEDREKDRLDFAASSVVREWSNYEGKFLARGRMIDLRNDRVVLDDNGVERCLPLRDLSDPDAAYVGRAWRLPISCGAGFEPYNGRDFIASTMQWKASGLCHKPLYFEEVELERYGHEVGPVLQPLISSVHFFGNIAVLPYKMGINPMSECQYALGYYRPGDCAPYMIPPIPWSLRGAASQARVVVGGAALIP